MAAYLLRSMTSLSRGYLTANSHARQTAALLSEPCQPMPASPGLSHPVHTYPEPPGLSSPYPTPRSHVTPHPSSRTTTSRKRPSLSCPQQTHRAVTCLGQPDLARRAAASHAGGPHYTGPRCCLQARQGHDSGRPCHRHEGQQQRPQGQPTHQATRKPRRCISGPNHASSSAVSVLYGSGSSMAADCASRPQVSMIELNSSSSADTSLNCP